MNNCKRCGHLCHCNKNDEHRIAVDCECIGCDCKINIHELAKANPNKTYRELEQERAEQVTYENNSGLIVVDCECINCNCPKNNVWNYEEDTIADKYEKQNDD
tara:strand:+ start:214 stop:522 length:309 start_codon:yes stop_codon:yes gene_type:complete